ncbi:MAG TPA: hypothetical protein VK177_11520 [Flavobacteriales bacterium]|nr:hypothetical protein [Flavobacteriales bacterium]
MARQIKCPHCGNWNSDSNQNCVSCQQSLVLKPANEQKNEKTSFSELASRLRSQSGWLDRFFENAKSGNVFMKSIAFLLQALWMVYFGILLFIVWMVTVVAG